MSTRCNFLAFTISAIAGQSVFVVTGQAKLKPTARAELDPLARTEMQRRFLLVFRQLGEAEQVAFLNGMQRHADGMPMVEAMRGVYVELGRTPPPAMLERMVQPRVRSCGRPTRRHP